MRVLMLLVLMVFPQSVSAQCFCPKCWITPSLSSFIAFSSAMAPSIDTDTCAVAREISGPVAAGDIVAFEDMNKGIGVFRVIGLPNDQIQMKKGRLWLNGQKTETVELSPFIRLFERNESSGQLPFCPNNTPIGSTCEISRFKETLPNGRSYEILDAIDSGPMDETENFIVPSGHVFVMGDHRDNSADSRLVKPKGVGFVPIENIIGIFEETLGSNPVVLR